MKRLLTRRTLVTAGLATAAGAAAARYGAIPPISAAFSGSAKH